MSGTVSYGLQKCSSTNIQYMHLRNITLANLPEYNSSEDSWTSKVEIDIKVGVKIVAFVLRLNLSTLLAAITINNFCMK